MIRLLVYVQCNFEVNLIQTKQCVNAIVFKLNN